MDFYIATYETSLIDKYYGTGTSKTMKEFSERADEITRRIKQIKGNNFTKLSKEHEEKLRSLIDKLYELNKETSKFFSKIIY